jgi:hypothetical protein
LSRLIERWFPDLTTKELQRSTHRLVGELNTSIRAWIQTWNATMNAPLSVADAFGVRPEGSS